MGCAKVHSGICAFVYAKRSYFSPPPFLSDYRFHLPCIVNQKWIANWVRGSSELEATPTSSDKKQCCQRIWALRLEIHVLSDRTSCWWSPFGGISTVARSGLNSENRTVGRSTWFSCLSPTLEAFYSGNSVHYLWWCRYFQPQGASPKLPCKGRWRNRYRHSDTHGLWPLSHHAH